MYFNDPDVFFDVALFPSPHLDSSSTFLLHSQIVFTGNFKSIIHVYFPAIEM